MILVLFSFADSSYFFQFLKQTDQILSYTIVQCLSRTANDDSISFQQNFLHRILLYSDKSDYDKPIIMHSFCGSEFHPFLNSRHTAIKKYGCRYHYLFRQQALHSTIMIPAVSRMALNISFAERQQMHCLMIHESRFQNFTFLHKAIYLCLYPLSVITPFPTDLCLTILFLDTLYHASCTIYYKIHPFILFVNKLFFKSVFLFILTVFIYFFMFFYIYIYQNIDFYENQ